MRTNTDSTYLSEVRYVCLDINECDIRTDNCSVNANCSNTQGSFNCTCKPGFDGDGISCTGNYVVP